MLCTVYLYNDVEKIKRKLNENASYWKFLVHNKLKKVNLLFFVNKPVSLKVAISEFGLSMLMFILLNHYMFMEVMRYVLDITWFESQ